MCTKCIYHIPETSIDLQTPETEIILPTIVPERPDNQSNTCQKAENEKDENPTVDK